MKGERLKVKGERLKVKGILILFFFTIFNFQFSICHAQSNVNYTVRVGETKENTVLAEFPESYEGKKVNISIEHSALSIQHSDSLDFVFADREIEALGTWGEQVFAYTDEGETEWTVWRSKKEPKNRNQAVKVKNGRDSFEQYLQETLGTRANRGWIWWIFAGVIGAAVLIKSILTIRKRRAEKLLSSVEQETLRRMRMGNRRHYISQAYLWILLLVLYAPIALIVIYSFTDSKILGNWTGFSLELYANLFTGHADAGLNSAILNTVIIALIAAVSSTILGTLAAIGIYNMRARHRKAISFLNSVPMINPDIITGISLFLLFVALGVSQGLATVCIAHVVFCTPYVVLSVLPRLSRMNPNTYEAALDLGATPFQALRKVMLPELWPGMLSGFILALTLSVDDFGVTFFTKGSGGLETLSTFIYSDARKGGLTPELRPLFTIILLVMLTALIVINVRSNKKAKKEQKQ